MSPRFLALPLAWLLACGGPPAAPATADAPTVLGAQDVVVAVTETITAGPRVSGLLDAAQKAVIRAEAAGSADAVLVEIGQVVGAGEVLARIEATAAQANQASASSGVAAAEQDAALAEREVARVRELVQIGALAARDLELAESGLQAANARLKAARAQAAGASEQVEGTVVRAPFAGVVSERSVNTGDVVAPGSPLFTVLDPATLRLAGAVPADAVATMKVGATVQVTVQGFPGRRFAGVVERIAPAVDPATRQIPVLVSIPNPEGVLMAGLFAEGAVALEVKDGVVVPSDALVTGTGGSTVLVVRDGKVERVPVETGIRNEMEERVEITRGISAGDVVLVGPAREVGPGTTVQMPAATASTEG